MARPKRGSSTRREVPEAETAAQALTEYRVTKEDEIDRLEELRQSVVHAQQLVEAIEEKAIALLEAQTTEGEVERVTKLMGDLQSQRLSAGLLFSWSNAGAILMDFILNFQKQILSLPSLLEAYKQRFPRGKLEVVPPFLLSTPSKSLASSK
ncbi:hypothetical protein LIER_37066 [Lithospermum erythrorhizon]|uniref:Uncharacterized protein n=1 Tax=Lithospermum erythrorhizon TaxID=34254 RepID=A0AAV3PIX1_LITER